MVNTLFPRYLNLTALPSKQHQRKHRKDSESQADKYFVSVKARLDFKREAFMFDSLLAIPTIELPIFISASHAGTSYI
jgi:hypothetical protein